MADGTIGVAVGDVTGRDAAALEHVRAMLRSSADEGSSPGLVLDRLERLVHAGATADLATAIYARLVVDRAGGLLLFSNAGHTAPLAALPSGRVVPLVGAASCAIGAKPMRPQRAAAAVSLPAGSALVFCTAGLLDGGNDPYQPVAPLSEVLASVPPAADPELLADAIVQRCLSRPPRSDSALLVIRLEERKVP